MPKPASPLNWPDLSGGLVLPFVFIPDGAPEPSAWPFPRSGAVRLPARFVPSLDDGGWRDRPAPQAMIRPANDPIPASAAWWSADEASSPDIWGVKRRPVAYGWAASSPAAPPDQAAKQTPSGNSIPAGDRAESQKRNEHPVTAANPAHGDRPRGVTPVDAPNDGPQGRTRQDAPRGGTGPYGSADLGSYLVAGKDAQSATTRATPPQPGRQTVDLANDGAGTIDAVKNLGSYVYRNLLQQPATDIRDLLNNPDQIPSALAGVLPGVAPVVGDVPQAVSRAIAALRALDKVQGSPPADVFSPEALIRRATRPYNAELTQAGRSLTKHPRVVGLSADNFQKALRSTTAIDRAGEEAIVDIVHNGVAVTRLSDRYGPIVQFRLPGGAGARFYGPGSQNPGKFIGFINPP